MWRPPLWPVHCCRGAPAARNATQSAPVRREGAAAQRTLSELGARGRGTRTSHSEARRHVGTLNPEEPPDSNGRERRDPNHTPGLDLFFLPTDIRRCRARYPCSARVRDAAVHPRSAALERGRRYRRVRPRWFGNTCASSRNLSVATCQHGRVLQG